MAAVKFVLFVALLNNIFVTKMSDLFPITLISHIAYDPYYKFICKLICPCGVVLRSLQGAESVMLGTPS